MNDASLNFSIEHRLFDRSSRQLSFPKGTWYHQSRTVLHTGGYATKIPIEGAEYAITSDEALHMDKLPNTSIVIVGAGYIACEFAGIYGGLGAKVHLMFRGDKVLRGFDDECRAQVGTSNHKHHKTC